MVEEEFLTPVFMNTLVILSTLGYREMDMGELQDEEALPVFFNKLTENYKIENIDKINGVLNNLMQIMGTPQGVLGVIDLNATIQKLSEWYDVDKSIFKEEGEIQSFLEQYLQSMQGQPQGGEVAQ
ncbi:hypothetical protein [Cetobacterium sp.]|uniref:hypothetical protein n=1 Tax=Cetobacterium sp. TaxID=2071632 RepID=UPI003F2BC167